MESKQQTPSELAAKHAKTKRKLKIIGLTLLGLGVALIATAITCAILIDFFLFLLLFPAMICTGTGLMLTVTAYRREIGSYMSAEQAPVVNQMANQIQPAITTFASAAKEGIKEVDSDKDGIPDTCPSCGKPTIKGALFCTNCGRTMAKNCPKCHTINPVEGKFCHSCGVPLDQ